jgi:hypothetical protein
MIDSSGVALTALTTRVHGHRQPRSATARAVRDSRMTTAFVLSGGANLCGRSGGWCMLWLMTAQHRT